MSHRVDNVIETDGALILGAGIAGLFTALKLSPFPALVLAGSRPGASGSSAWAQGGIAAAVGEGDDWRDHAADTIAAGAGLCDTEIVNLVAREAPDRIADLVAMGAPFDRDANGLLALGREAAHSRARIVHVTGDRAGAEISRTLAAQALATPSIRIMEGFHAVELAMEDGKVVGLFARHGTGPDARLVLFKARAVIFATGGLGALYAVTTNPLEARGEGLGMAARAGAVIADPEFVQFHPTAIDIGRDPAPLATEALRGEGAVLINDAGERFMLSVHNDAELAPRDVVARAIHRQIANGHRVFLDCRDAIGEKFAAHFPTVYAACMSAGIDPARQPIPVAPAAHYHMGGIASDALGRTSLPGLWVAGECAATGLHGANRLASNSLLEGLVFGARVAEDVRNTILAGTAHGQPPAPVAFALPAPPHVLRAAMNRHVGLERNAEGLDDALGVIARLEQSSGGEPALLNMLAAARLVTAAALARTESRGGHWRSDFPLTQKIGTRTFITLPDAVRDEGLQQRLSKMPIALEFTRPPADLLIEGQIRAALQEDLGRAGDVTSELTIPADQKALARLVARKRGHIAGLIAARIALRLVDASLTFNVDAPDGSKVEAGALIATVAGTARAILTAERVALNFAGHLSGVATATAALVDAVKGTKARIVCTRKTLPNLRILQKYAVRCGGGFNHRFGLDDAVLIKDNHIAAAGGIAPVLERVRAGLGHMTKIEIEVDTLEQLEEALSLSADTILLDNMTPDDLMRAVTLAKGRAVLEASGNVTLATVRAIAETGVDYISSGAITHSATNLDIGLDF